MLPIRCGYVSRYSDEEILQSSFTSSHLELLKNETRGLFQFSWNSYKEYGLPYDEVKPLSCTPNKRRKDSLDLQNDVLGNYHLTLFDNLDSLLVLGLWDQFNETLQYLEDINFVDFDIDSDVSLFETDIRVLGGLLSAHLYLTDERHVMFEPKKGRRLLELAVDLADRLLPAFDTPTGVPLPRVNLKGNPVNSNLPHDTCTACATTPLLEFSLLSRLTNNPIYEKVSKRSFYQIWNSRSSINLLPMTIDPLESKWLDNVSGIGASIDSFYEYALKGAILFDDEDLFNVWNIAYNSVQGNMKTFNDYLTVNVDVTSGKNRAYWIDSLSAFWPGLQVLAGHIKPAVKSHLVYLKIWNCFQSIPERWSINGDFTIESSMSLEWYPLRPEFIESTYHLYRSTRDPIYLAIGQDLLMKLRSMFLCPCGLCGFQDIRSGIRQDRMESFVLSETLKYLYLLFDENNYIHNVLEKQNNMIFSTEGHPFWLATHNRSLNDPAQYFTTSPLLTEHKFLDRIPLLGTLWNRLYPEKTTSDRPTLPSLSLPHSSCELVARNTDTFLSSHLLQNPTICHIDKIFEKSLITPPYVNSTTAIEFQDNFYHNYGGANKDSLTSTPILETEVITYRIDPFFGGQNTLMDFGLDFVIPTIRDLRLSFEIIKPFETSSLGLLDNAAIDAFSPLFDNRHLDYVTKLVSINGVDIPTNSNVYCVKVSPSLIKSDQIRISTKGYFTFDNNPVINLIVYTDLDQDFGVSSVV
ncbi:hypothetical protein LJB42_003917 [Komagataella kurtzmanii]|nr:hypothetical protein LJB42_003917 [Komagataella kurtzmanii]